MPRPGRASRSHRPAFTLLEVLLAFAIGILLMGGLYVAVNVQFRQTQAGRDVVEQSTLVRGLMARMAVDISETLGSINTGSGGQSGSQGAGQASTGQTGTAAGSSTSMASTSSNSSSGSTSSSSTSTATTGTSPVNFGVRGDSSHLVLLVSRVPREFTLGPNSASGATSTAGVSDLRRVCYWLVSEGESAHGLARQEYKPVTSDDALTSLPPDIPDEASYVIAEEVASLSFSYFDGTSWQDSWDGTAPGPDGVTPQGAPMAIAMVLGIPVPGTPDLKYYRHVVAIPTANNWHQVASTNGSAPTNPGTNGQ